MVTWMGKAVTWMGKAIVHIHKAGTGNIDAGVCSRTKFAGRETGRARQYPSLLPTTDVGEAHPEHDGPTNGTRVP